MLTTFCVGRSIETDNEMKIAIEDNCLLKEENTLTSLLSLQYNSVVITICVNNIDLTEATWSRRAVQVFSYCV